MTDFMIHFVYMQGAPEPFLYVKGSGALWEKKSSDFYLCIERFIIIFCLFAKFAVNDCVGHILSASRSILSAYSQYYCSTRMQVADTFDSV